MTSKRLALLPAALLVLSLGAFAAPAAAVAHSRHGAHTARRSRTVRFYARVVTTSRDGVLVRTLSGRRLHFSAVEIARQRAPLAKHRRLRVRESHRTGMHFAFMAGDAPPPAGPVAINIVGLQPGVTVLIAKTVNRDGRVTVEITLPPSNVTAQQTDSGVVADVEDGSFQITDGGGTVLRFAIAAARLSNLKLRDCSTVAVVYHQYGSLLIADEVRPAGASASPDCTPASAATGVEHAERYASGRVTAVSSRRVTILVGETGRSETFATDSRQGLQLCISAFDGVHVGDQIDVTYHRSRTAMVADSVSDPGAGS